MFVQSRVVEAAGKYGVEVMIAGPGFSTDTQSSGDGLLIVVDLDSSEYDPFVLAGELRQTLGRGAVLLGFYPHIKRDLELRAVEAGFDHVVTSREFVKRLGELLGSERGASGD
ncbi:MAG TPA: hypothetical protein VE177_02330 [Candidatus Binatus sp.]|nr:hypothetical protein [Candidatus Binatus sp.]